MRRVVLATLAVLVAAGVLFVRGRGTPDARIAVADHADGAAAGSAPAGNDRGAAAGVGAPREALARRPRSLRGTRVDGGLVVDDGHFVPTLDARRMFDYFLTATGEVPEDALRARLQHEIARRLPPEAAREATLLLERYLTYRERVRHLATVDVPSDDDLDARLATLVALRREVLGPDAAEAFFADEEADAQRLLDARRIANDPSLSPEERATRVEDIFAAAEADLPADVRATRKASRLANALRGAEEEIRAQGGADADVAAMRTRLAGPEAAARLADLDQRRNAWQSRVDAFRAARERVRHDPSLAPEARAAAVARLLEESFTSAERRRVEALDRIAADPATTAPE